jgi:Domain of unknown function (DUF4262)
MCWQCDHPEASLDDYLDVLYDKVVEHGWAVQFVESERNPFSYTVGLHECGLPELLVTAVDPPRALQVLNAVADYCVCEEPPAPGDEIELPDGVVLEVVEVAQPDAHLGMAINMYGSEVRALQLVWSDRRGRWPWSADFNPGGRRQPVLGPRTQNA